MVNYKPHMEIGYRGNDNNMEHTTQNSRTIKAAPEKLYRALTTPEALEQWQAPGNMTGKVHSFDLREGGGYQMSLYYAEEEPRRSGKTAAREDRFTVKFVKLDAPHRIIQSVVFDSNDPRFAGEMMMEITFEPVGDATDVTFLFKNIPPGIKPEDNEAGTASSLEKLAHYVE
jgi:uncharacterized protein YndB with AHSA1/START domain